MWCLISFKPSPSSECFVWDNLISSFLNRLYSSIWTRIKSFKWNRVFFLKLYHSIPITSDFRLTSLPVRAMFFFQASVWHDVCSSASLGMSYYANLDAYHLTSLWQCGAWNEFEERVSLLHKTAMNMYELLLTEAYALKEFVTGLFTFTLLLIYFPHKV